MHILLVEEARNSASSYLDDDRAVVLCAEDVAEAMTLLRTNRFDAVVLNLGSRPWEAFRLIRRMRASGDATPILALPGVKSGDRGNALAFGADDAACLSVTRKAFWERLANLCRPGLEACHDWLEIGDVRLCLATRRMFVIDREIRLTRMEFDVVRSLMLRRGSVVARSALLAQLYEGRPQPDPKVLDVVMRHVRKKLEHAGVRNMIGTVWGHGFVITNVNRTEVMEERLAA
ncbi:MAG TPA: response regulator transcription factor [Rhodopila sp.]|uniref:response regulator transcription factor n=1 Tax=Rhodopila sp. TaxID=2480087 RepID=UPI002C87BE8F|nr:response regulator transcription factor [Rhodopila sp.]HVY18374.1 response regulator transcription factor [Rhodopila sp.]